MPDESQQTGDQQQPNSVPGQSEFAKPIDFGQESAVEPIESHTDMSDENISSLNVEVASKDIGATDNQAAELAVPSPDNNQASDLVVNTFEISDQTADTQTSSENPTIISSNTLPEQPAPTMGPETIQPEAIIASSVAGVAAQNPPVKKGGLKMKLVVLIGAIILFIALICGFLFWYENPQKVLADSIVNAIKAKTSVYTGSYAYTSKDSDAKYKITVDISTKTAAPAGSFDANLNVNYNNKTYKISGSALADGSGDFYVKFGNIDGIIKDLETTLGVESDVNMSQSIDKFVAKINNNWIKISSSDLKSYSEEASVSQKCFNTTLEKYSKDKAIAKEVTNVYKKNAFMAIDKNLGVSDYQYGFKVKVDKSVLKSFLEQFKTTKVYKDLHSCDNSFAISEADISSASESASSSENGPTLKLWTSMFSHKLTKLEVSDENSSGSTNLTLNAKYNQTITITKPAKSISLTQLKSYIDEITSSYESQYDSSYYTDGSNVSAF